MLFICVHIYQSINCIELRTYIWPYSILVIKWWKYKDNRKYQFLISSWYSDTWRGMSLGYLQNTIDRHVDLRMNVHGTNQETPSLYYPADETRYLGLSCLVLPYLFVYPNIKQSHTCIWLAAKLIVIGFNDYKGRNSWISHVLLWQDNWPTNYVYAAKKITRYLTYVILHRSRRDYFFITDERYRCFRKFCCLFTMDSLLEPMMTHTATSFGCVSYMHGGVSLDLRYFTQQIVLRLRV